MSRSIDENVEAVLRTLSATPPDAPLPEAVVSKYWELKRINDRASGAQLSTEQLAVVVLLAGEGKAVPSDAKLKFVPELYLSGEIKANAKLEVVWRKKTHTGTLKRITNDNKVVVEIDGSERTIDATDCRPLPVAV